MTPADVLKILFNAGQMLLAVMALAFVIERLIQHAGKIARGAFPNLPLWVLGVASLLAGLPLGLLLTFDPFNGLFVSPWVGKSLAGLLIGGGSNVVHDVYARFLEVIALRSAGEKTRLTLADGAFAVLAPRDNAPPA